MPTIPILNRHSVSQSLPIVVVLAVIGFLAVYPLQDFDTFWHLANGRAMVEQRTIINQEIFSFTANGKPFSNHAWLAQVIFYLIFQATGANGLIAAKVLMLTGIGLFLYRFGLRQRLAPLPAALICTLALGASLFRYVERPELFSYLFLTLLAGLLFAYRDNRLTTKVLPLVPLIMLVWDCMHGALYGVILLAAFMLGETGKAVFGKDNPLFPPLPKRQLTTLWLWLGITLAVMLISPYGLRSYDIFIEFVSNNLMTSMTAEFKPTPINGQPLFWALLALTAVSVLAHGRAIDLTSLALLIPFTGLAIRYVRGIGPFAIVAAMLLAVNVTPLLAKLTRSADSKRRQDGLCLVLLIVGLTWALYYKLSPPPRYDSLGLGISDDGFPVGSARFVKAAKLSGNMYNTDRYGGYLAYYLFPERKIFHYNHHMLFNALERYVHEPETRAQWNINYAIIGRSDEWDMFSKDGFVPVYWEPSGAVMIKKNDQNREIIQRYAIRYFSPVMAKDEFYQQAKNPVILPVLAREMSDYLAFRHDREKTDILVEVLANQSLLPPAVVIELLARAEPFNGDNVKLVTTLGSLYYQEGRPESAEKFLTTALRLDPNQIEARFSLAYLLYDRQDYAEALGHFKKILAATPNHADTLYGLGLCAAQLGRYQEARTAFQGYLDQAPQGQWAEKARNYLTNLPLGS